MEYQIFEAKFEIDKDAEKEIVEKLDLEFDNEHEATDHYLNEEGLKIKFVSDGRIILYEVKFDGNCFDIKGKDIGEEEKDELLKNNPIKIEINRKKRQYRFKEFNVKIDFDYMKQFPNRLFLEIHSDNKEDVLKAKKYVEEKLGLDKFIMVAYDALLQQN